jgi:hypothetical protein
MLNYLFSILNEFLFYFFLHKNQINTLLSSIGPLKSKQFIILIQKLQFSKKKKPTNIVNNTQLQLFGEGCVILIKGSFETIVLISTILKINFFFKIAFLKG